MHVHTYACGASPRQHLAFFIIIFFVFPVYLFLAGMG
jgi:hypothetical protein